MFVSFTSDPIYAPCESRHLTIAVDTPTMLTLFTSATRVSAGDTVLCTGQLTSLMDGSPVPQQTNRGYGKQQPGGFRDNKRNWLVHSRCSNTVSSLRVLLWSPRDSLQMNHGGEMQPPMRLNSHIVMMFPYWDTLIIITGVAALVPVFFFFRRRIITLGKKKPLRVPSVTT